MGSNFKGYRYSDDYLRCNCFSYINYRMLGLVCFEALGLPMGLLWDRE